MPGDSPVQPRPRNEEQYAGRPELLAASETPDFERELFAAVARRHDLPVARVDELHRHWFDEVPLALLARHAVPGISDLFAAMRRRGIVIGVLSDHRADLKLKALGLTADIVVSAAEIGLQKPHQLGLETLLKRAGVAAGEAVVIGDRSDRDGAIAERVGTRFLLRGATAAAQFRRFDDPVFQPLLAAETPAVLAPPATGDE